MNKYYFFYFKNLQNDGSNKFYLDMSNLENIPQFEEHFIHFNILSFAITKF